MTFLRHTFLYQLWNHSKWIFCLVVFFIIGQSFFTYKGIQNFPFYHWGMYSGPFPAKDNYVVYEVYLDDERFDLHSKTTMVRDDWHILLSRFEQLSKSERNVDEILTGRLSNRISSEKLAFVKQRIMNDSNIQSSFPKWFEIYLKEGLNQSFDSLTVYKATYQYELDQPGMIRSTTEKLF